MIATICLYALVSVSESVSVKFSALYLVLKVSEKSGIGPPLLQMFIVIYVFLYLNNAHHTLEALTICM